MIDNQNLFYGKGKYLIGFTLLLFITVICAAFSINNDNSFDISRREILLRRIGHELLLQSGDVESSVLPIKKIAENEYQIRFGNKLTFETQFLVNTTRRLLEKDPLESDYVVNVINSANSNVVYGYAISKNGKENIITCIGRKQPIADYAINFKFKPTINNNTKKGYLLGSLPFLAFVGFVFFRSVKPSRLLAEQKYSSTFNLGCILFDAKNRKLNINGQTTELTGTESRLLHIFALSPNEIIERSRLQKEIWEDAGVIVGRSLDMFISKLRKKLEVDLNVKIVVVRGKGYMLKIYN